MKVVTIMDYIDAEAKVYGTFNSNYYNMTKIWINRVIRYAPECEVELLFVNEKDNILFTEDYQRFLKNFSNISLTKMEPMGYHNPKKMANNKATYDYKHALWTREAPFIFLDTDLFLFSDLKNFYKHIGDAPFAGTGHGSSHRNQERALNGGLYYMGKTGLVDPEKAKDAFDGEPLDQNVLFNYLTLLDIDPFIVPENVKWNWYGRESEVKKINGNYEAFNMQGERLHGVHFFGQWRPWRIASLKSFWEDSVKEVEDMST
jgi:hypothetical protein